MPTAILHRYTFPMREAMSALLGEDQVDAESIEIRVVGNCVVVDLVNPTAVFVEDADDQPADETAIIDPDKKSSDHVDDASAGDQSAPDNDEETVEPEKLKGGALAQRAGIICGEKAFWIFIDETSADGAAAALRNTCGVESRAELDHNPLAGREFRKLVAEYDAWCKE